MTEQKPYSIEEFRIKEQKLKELFERLKPIFKGRISMDTVIYEETGYQEPAIFIDFDEPDNYSIVILYEPLIDDYEIELWCYDGGDVYTETSMTVEQFKFRLNRFWVKAGKIINSLKKND